VKKEGKKSERNEKSSANKSVNFLI